MSYAYIERYITLNIKKLIDLSVYRGIRHQACLPVHGQRTRTNANTQRSKRRKIEELKKINEKIKRYKK
jgi:small subunit ribosomal protein S13